MSKNIEVTAQDIIAVQSEMDYIAVLISQLDPKDMAQAKEILLLNERYEYLDELLNLFRAKFKRAGFTLIQGGKSGG